MQAATRTRVRMNRDDRRLGILAEAIGVIGERGFRGFSIRDLAARCGVTDAGLLHHFGSKNDLLLALLDERDRQDEAAIAELLEADGADARDTAQGIRQILAALAARNAEHPELVRLYAMLRVEALAPDHPAHAYFVERDRAARTRFGELLAPLTDDSQSLARRVLAALDGLELQWICEGCEFDLSGEWNRIAERLIVQEPPQPRERTEG